MCRLMGGETEFILSNSGHLQSLINPPGNPKAMYYTNKDFPPRADRWLEGAESKSESWWIRWNEWLSERSGELKNAPKSLGNKAHPPISQAPGRICVYLI